MAKTYPVKLKCAACASGSHAVTLAEVDPETGEGQGPVIKYHLGHPDGRGNVAAFSKPDYGMSRNDDDTAWVVDCSTGKGCGARYEVTDDELRRAVELGRDRKPSDVFVPAEVGCTV